MSTDYGRHLYKDHEMMYQKSEKLAAEICSLNYHYDYLCIGTKLWKNKTRNSPSKMQLKPPK